MVRALGLLTGLLLLVPPLAAVVLDPAEAAQQWRDGP